MGDGIAAVGVALLEPETRDYAFGGERLARYGKRLSGRTAETWEFSLYPGRESHIAGTGERLDRFLERAWGLDARARAGLPLVKLLDVQGELPVHCHPGDVEARTMAGDDPGKDEAWLVLEAGPDAAVYLGFERPLSDADAALVLDGADLRERMTRLTPQAGDVVMVPRGVAHSARDVVLWEVQETSDRSLLAERVDLWGAPLPPDAARAQLREFLAVVRRGPPPRGVHAAGVLAPDARRAIPLAGCDHFVMEALPLAAPTTLPPGAYTVGAGAVDAGGGATLDVGATFLVGPRPAPLSPAAPGTVLLAAWRPDPERSAALRAAGRHFEAL